MPQSPEELKALVESELERLSLWPQLHGQAESVRYGAVERNILRIAIHELDVGEIPPHAVIDEAVTLAKQYSTREAGRLVNGILDRIYREAA